MKVLMIGFNIQEDVFPLGLTYLKGYASQFHSDVEFKIKEFSFGNRFNYDTNANIELKIISYVLHEKPDLVCFSCYIWNSRMIKNICNALKKISDVKIALGGAEVDNSFRDYCDYLMLGEGELKFKELIDHIKNGKEWSEDEKLVENLDEIPFPYRFHEGKKDYVAVRIETSRGCPYSCGYCNYAERKYREYSIEYLEKGVKYLFENYTFRNLTIIDATFNLNKDRMKKVLDIIKKYSKKVKVNMELKPELLDEEVIDIMKKSKLKIGCELGIQSISKDVLKGSKRPFDIEKIKECLELLNNSRIAYKIDMMYGLPNDNFFKFLRTVNFIMKYSKQKQLPAHHFMVLNNTALCSDKESIRYLDTTSSMVLKTNSQGPLDLYKQKLFIDMINKKVKKR